MPLYEYRCTACQQRFTHQESITDHGGRRPRPPCPKCHSADVEPIPSPFFAKTIRKS